LLIINNKQRSTLIHSGAIENFVSVHNLLVLTCALFEDNAVNFTNEMFLRILSSNSCD